MPTPATASPALAAELQDVLADLIDLHLQGKQAHWTIQGPGFLGLHAHLDLLVEDLRQASDTVAERMRALGAVPDGRATTIAEHNGSGQFPAGVQDTATAAGLIASALTAAAARVRAALPTADAQDPVTADLLHAVIDTLDKHAWMVGAEAPRSSN